MNKINYVNIIGMILNMMMNQYGNMNQFPNQQNMMMMNQNQMMMNQMMRK